MGRIAADGGRGRRAGFHDLTHAQPPHEHGRPDADADRRRAKSSSGSRRRSARPAKACLQVVSDFVDFDDEIGTLRAMAEASRRPLSISVAAGSAQPARTTAASSTRSPSRTPTGSRCERRSPRAAIGILLGLQGSVNPLARSATYNALADLPLAERVAAPARSRREGRECSREFAEHPMRTLRLDQVYGSASHRTTSPTRRRACQREPRAKASSADSLLYDLLLGDGGTAHCSTCRS